MFWGGNKSAQAESLDFLTSVIPSSSPFIGADALGQVGGTGSSGVKNSNLSLYDGNSLLPIIPDTALEQEGNTERDFVLTYKIKEGDTIISIANTFGITPNTVVWANGLRNRNEIRIGQELLILPVNGVGYIVKKGDTIESIAKEFKADVNEIISFNDVSGPLITGDDLFIPDGILPSSYAQEVTGNKKSSPSYTQAPKKTSKLFAYYSSLPNYGGFFTEPTLGRISQLFHGKNAVDIANSCGTPIKPAAPGLITVADGTGWNGGYGKLVVIDHNNGTQTLYAHLSKVSVKTGDFVPYDKIVGLMGTTGRSTGCHLHFETHGARNLYIKNYISQSLGINK